MTSHGADPPPLPDQRAQTENGSRPGRSEQRQLGPAGAVGALDRLRAEVEGLTLPMEVPGAAEMRLERQRALRLLDDYLGRRLSGRDVPMLVVISGPTGAGKSTLLNSLVGAPVSASGVLRPTTQTPVLVYNPEDGPAFFSRRLLPNLSATTLSGRHRLNPNDGSLPGALAMRLVPSDDLAPGLAVLDSPDFDSYQTGHHDLAADLLDVADLWLYVTTGTDYARAVPWEFLRTAAARRLGVVAVLNRMRPDEIGAVSADLARMLGERGLGDAPMFVIPETMLFDGKIPLTLLGPLQAWLVTAAGEAARRGHVDRALDGTIDQVLVAVDRLADAATDQVAVDRRLRVDLSGSFRDAREAIRQAIWTGTINIAPIDAAWQLLTAPPVVRRSDRLRRRLVAQRLPGPDAYRALAEAFVAVLTSFARVQIRAATTRVAERWSTHPAASTIGLDRILDLPKMVDDQLHQAVRDWLRDAAIAAQDGPTAGGRQAIGFGAPALSGASLRLATLALVSRSDGVERGAAAGYGAPAAGIEQAPAGALDELRDDLVRRLGAVCGTEESRLSDLLGGVSESTSTGLRDAAEAVRAAWNPKIRR